MKYLQHISLYGPEIIEKIRAHKSNDLVGQPIKYDYPGAGEISPTTLRYLKVATELKLFFGDEIEKIVEIGVGYGVQLLVLGNIVSVDKYTLVDLDPVLNLA